MILNEGLKRENSYFPECKSNNIHCKNFMKQNILIKNIFFWVYR